MKTNLKKKIRLLIFSDGPLFFDGKNYAARNPLPELYDELSAYFDIVISGPVKQLNNNKEFGIYTKVSNQIVCSPRPFFNTMVGFFKKLLILFIPTLRNISVNIKNSDIIMLKLPSPIGIFVYFYTKLYSKSIFLYVGGDEKQVAIMGNKYRGLKKPLALAVANAFAWLTRFMTRNTLVFTNGKELLNKLKTNSNKCINFIPSLIKEEDIFFREDTCRNKLIRLIYAGRIVPVKGLPYLLKALKILQEKGINIHLTMVGKGSYQERLSSIAKELGIINLVELKGHLPFGEKLFKLYRECDIFILPSLSEGLPKVLIEAMAFGLPIVATRVGGIPHIIENKKTGILVPPKSAEKIVEAVEEIINDSKLRKNLIKNGYKFIENYSLERQAQFMATAIKQYFDQNEICK